MRTLLGTVAAALLAISVCVSAMAGPPYPLKRNLVFDERSPYALVVFDAEPQELVPTWNLELFAFAPDTHTWTYGPLSGWARFVKIPAQAQGRRFHAALVKPAGTYAINNINTQGYWHACFNGGTRSFALQAGKVNYIGLIDPNPALEQIFHELPQETSAAHLFVFDTPQLQLTAPAQRPDWNADLSAFLANELPQVTAPIVAAEPVETTFAPGKSFIAGKLCQKY